MNNIDTSSEDAQLSPNIHDGQIDIRRLEFEAIKEEAAIPELSGIAGAVIKLLQKRLRQPGNYDIDDIAEALQLSRRSLQRHLKKQQTHYAVLHDKVRYKLAIDCLLKQHMSLKVTGAHLGFSDRTSFTCAFKRWSGMSPGAFCNAYLGFV